MNSFGTSVDLRKETINKLFLKQVGNLTAKTARLESINVQFSDLWT